MTDEELADTLVLADVAPETIGCVERLCTPDKRCKECYMEWLASPCENPCNRDSDCMDGRGVKSMGAWCELWDCMLRDVSEWQMEKCWNEYDFDCMTCDKFGEKMEERAEEQTK
jgi:hypothetical protein